MKPPFYNLIRKLIERFKKKREIILSFDQQLGVKAKDDTIKDGKDKVKIPKWLP